MLTLTIYTLEYKYIHKTLQCQFASDILSITLTNTSYPAQKPKIPEPKSTPPQKMSSLRRSTRERWATGEKPKRKPATLPKLPHQEAPELWPPKNLPKGLIYYPPDSEAQATKEVKPAPQRVSRLCRDSSEETLVYIDDAASDATISARSSPGIVKRNGGSAVGRGGRDPGRSSTEAVCLRGRMMGVWDRRRRDLEKEVYEKGEPMCEVAVSDVRFFLDDGRKRKTKRKRMGKRFEMWEEK